MHRLWPRTALESDPPGRAGPTIDAGRDAPAARDAGPDAPEPVRGVSGIWVGPLTLGGTDRTFTYVLLARPAGGLVGYLAGSPPERYVVVGETAGDELSLVLEMNDPRLMRRVEIRGHLEGDRIVGTSDAGDEPRPFEWRRSAVAEERRWVMWEAPGELVDVAAALGEGTLDASGEMVSGGFVSRSFCDPFACGGALAAVREERGPSGWTLELVLGMPGSTTTMVRASSPDVAPLRYVGTYEGVASDGTVRTGTIEVARAGSARIANVQAMMAALAAIADAQAAGPPFPELPIAGGYRHDGSDRDDLLAVFEMESRAVGVRRVELERLSEAVDFASPLDDPTLTFAVGVAHREALYDGMGGLFRYRDTASDDELRYFGVVDGRWVVVGNGR